MQDILFLGRFQIAHETIFIFNLVQAECRVVYAPQVKLRIARGLIRGIGGETKSHIYRRADHAAGYPGLACFPLPNQFPQRPLFPAPVPIMANPEDARRLCVKARWTMPRNS